MSDSSTSTFSLPVLIGGLFTTVIALAAVWWLGHNAEDFNVMNWYGWYVIPIGPFLVGLLAGSGYGIVARLTSFRGGSLMLMLVVVFQLAAYLIAQYIDYQEIIATAAGYTPTFLEYFDFSTRAIAFEGSGVLGVWGYGIRALEVVGFVGGALLILAGVQGQDYCDECQRYMKPDHLAEIPASAGKKPGRLAKAEKKAAYETANEAAFREGAAAHDALLGLVEAGNASAFGTQVRALSATGTTAAGLPAHFRLDMMSCPECRKATISSVLRTVKGRDTHDEKLRALEVEPAFVKEAGL